MSYISGKGHRRRRESYSDDEDSNTDSNLNREQHETQDQQLDEAAEVETAKTVDLEKARNVSRAEYLKRRFESKILDLERDIESLSRKAALSADERKELDEKIQILESITAARSSNDTEYQLPQGFATDTSTVDRKRKRELLNSRDSYKKESTIVEERKKHKFENQWELDQLRKAQEIVSANPDAIQIPDLKEYEYVFDDSQFVDFEENSEDELDQEEDAEVEEAHSAPKVLASIKEVRESLPVFGLRHRFLELVQENQVLIVVGETGSGKTTQLPQYLYEAGYTRKSSEPSKIFKVGCTQPRRVAATSVAARVAEEVGAPLGDKVGYSIRFEEKSSDKTEIKYMTDGMLLREFLTDPLLSSYSALMVDEAHERTVATEIILSLLKDIIRERQDLKLIVASATINASKFSEYFDNAPVFNIPGRRFPVDLCYTKSPEANYIQAAITTIFHIHTTQEKGDILVFLTGQDEIETVAETLEDACEKLGDLIQKLLVAPIYANLPPHLQARIFEPTPPKARKVVLATNIAETSITIDGIRYVIDPGYVKENVFNPTTGMESLVVVPCSRASADQRAGRAGRVGPGKCYRLYTKWSFQNELPPNATPEILRTNLSTIVLLLLSMGITDLIHFDFMDPPSTQTLIKSFELLYALGALSAKGELTPLGRKMAEFPMDPMFCKCIIKSNDYGVTQEILSIMALLAESSSLFYGSKDKREQVEKRKEHFIHEAGDHLTLLNIWNEWTETGYSKIWCEENFLQYRSLKRARDVRTQLERLCRRVDIEVPDEEVVQSDDKSVKIQKTLLAGFFPNVARLSKLGTNYVQLKRKQQVNIHPSSVLFPSKPPPKLILYHELVLTSKEYMRNCMRIEEKWLGELARHYYKTGDLDSKKS